MDSGQVKAIHTHHRNILRHPQTGLLQRSDGARRNVITAGENCGRAQRIRAVAQIFTQPFRRFIAAEAVQGQQMLAAVKPQVHGMPGVAHPLQSLLHGVAAQAMQRQDLPVSLLKQIAR